MIYIYNFTLLLLCLLCSNFIYAQNIKLNIEDNRIVYRDTICVFNSEPEEAIHDVYDWFYLNQKNKKMSIVNLSGDVNEIKAKAVFNSVLLDLYGINIIEYNYDITVIVNKEEMIVVFDNFLAKYIQRSSRHSEDDPIEVDIEERYRYYIDKQTGLVSKEMKNFNSSVVGFKKLIVNRFYLK